MIRPRSDRLFERFRRTGDPRALAAVFDRAAPELWRVAAHLCRDRHGAEDLVQGTFLTAIEDKDSWDPARPVLPWLLGILANRAREARRRVARVIDPARVAMPGGERDPADDAGFAELDAAMRAALARVPSPYRETLEQHLVHGKAPHEIADQLGVAAGTVRMRVHRGLDHLRRHLPRGFVTAGAVALRVPPESLAAMREVVLARVPGGSAAGLAAGSGYAVLTVIGVLAMKKTVLTVVASAAVALTAWLAWPPPAGDPAARAPASVGQPAVADRTAASAAVIETVDEPAAVGTRSTVPGGARVGTGRLRVVVRNAATGAGVAGAMLQVWAERLDYGRTDRDGVATFDLAAGAAHVRLPTLASELDRGVVVVAGVETDVTIDLQPKIRVAATVLDLDGLPVPAARIVGHTLTDPGSLVDRELGRTGQDGCWNAAIIEGGLWIRAIVDGWAATPKVAVKPMGDTVVRVELRVTQPAATIAGVVRSVDGVTMPGAGIAIEARGAGAGPPTQAPIVAEARADGTFEVTWAPPGPCSVFAWRVLADGQKRITRADAVAVAGGRTLVDLQFGRGGRVSGVIRRADGAPADDVSVRVLPLRMVDWMALAGEAGGHATTAADGSYAIDGILPGAYRLIARLADAELSEDVELAEGADLRWEPTFGAARSIDVRVLRFDRVPLAGWSVSAAPEQGLVRQATTDVDGRARFEGVTDGDYRVAARAPNARFASVTEVGVAAGAATVLTVPADAMPDAAVRGVLRPTSGIAIGDLTLRLMRQGTSDRLELRADPDDGAFAVDALVPDTYDLLIERGRVALAFRKDVVLSSGRVVDLGVIGVGEAGGVLFDIVRTDGARATDPFVGGRVAGQGGPFAHVPQQRVADGVEVRDVPPLTFDVLVWGADIAPVLTSVTTHTGEREIVPVVAEPAVRTTVQFAREDGGALGGTVTVRSAGGASVASEMLRDRENSPWVRGLPPGRYTIELRAHDGALGRAEFTVAATPGEPIAVPVHR